MLLPFFIFNFLIFKDDHANWFNHEKCRWIWFKAVAIDRLVIVNFQHTPFRIFQSTSLHRSTTYKENCNRSLVPVTYLHGFSKEWRPINYRLPLSIVTPPTISDQSLVPGKSQGKLCCWEGPHKSSRQKTLILFSIFATGHWASGRGAEHFRVVKYFPHFENWPFVLGLAWG